MDVRAMNISLLAKWIDRLEKGDDNLCCSLLRKKYLGGKKAFFRSEIDKVHNSGGLCLISENGTKKVELFG
jgi:hypothetical protein